MELSDFLALVHPAIAVVFVFPLIGMVILNCVALLLFIGQGMTGTRDLLEIPLSWQEPYIYKCDFVHKTCPTPNLPN